MSLQNPCAYIMDLIERSVNCSKRACTETREPLEGLREDRLRDPDSVVVPIGQPDNELFLKDMYFETCFTRGTALI